MKFDFTDKPSYLAWRAKWKADYKELSESIRDLKRRRKVYIRRYERSTNASGQPVRTLIGKEPNPLHDLRPGAHSLSMQASFMLEHLKGAKALSWSLKVASAKQAAA